MRESRMRPWQVTLLVVGSVLILGPIVWDFLTATFEALADIKLEDIFTRDGMFVVGFVLLVIVGAVEFFKDSTNKPTSKHIK